MRIPPRLESRDYFSSKQVPVAVTHSYPEKMYADHTHQFYEIAIVWRGNGLHILNDEPNWVTYGDIFYIQANDHHRYESANNLVLDNIIYCPERLQLNAPWSLVLPPFDSTNHNGYWRLTTRGMTLARPIIHQMDKESRKIDPLSIQLTESLLLQLAIVLKRHRYRSALAYLLPDGETLDLLMLALQQSVNTHFDMAEFCLKHQRSERSLKLLFRQHTGMSIRHYLRQIRLCYARRLLRQSGYRISEVAALCGFDDSNYFSTVFTRETGMTPRDYRQYSVRPSLSLKDEAEKGK